MKVDIKTSQKIFLSLLKLLIKKYID